MTTPAPLPPRVASLVPAATEWLYALGLQERLVAVTFECVSPPDAKREKPWIVRSEMESFDGDAADIDAHVRTKGASLYRLDRDVLRETQPDTLIVQSLCDACSASESHALEAATVLPDRLHVFALAATRLEDVWEDAVAVASAAGDAEAGQKLVHELRERVENVRIAVAGRDRPRVAVLEWTDPPMRSGHWHPDVVKTAGGVEVLGEAGEQSAPCTWKDVEASEADIILVAPCGLPLERSLDEARRVAKRFPGKRVVALDASRYLSGSGPSLATAVEIIAHILHPEAWPHDADPDAWREAR